MDKERTAPEGAVGLQKGRGGAPREDLVDWNARVHRWKGVGAWRALYLWFLRRLDPTSIVEFGCGDPAFLQLVGPEWERIAIDGNDRLRSEYEKLGIGFYRMDLDRDGLPAEIRDIGVAVCSDVFEHLIFPTSLLEKIEHCLGRNGVLFSHVPNEFQWRRTLRILLGRRAAVYHHGAEEWNDPHLRRFTDLGYRRFLAQRFRYNLKINDLRYRGWARVLSGCRLPVPYGLEGGPTYASTNDPEVFRRLASIKENLRRDPVFRRCRGGLEGLEAGGGGPGS